MMNVFIGSILGIVAQQDLDPDDALTRRMAKIFAVSMVAALVLVALKKRRSSRNKP